MKKSLSIVITILCLMGSHLSAWAQASTEGKEFWVALIMASSPNGLDASDFHPYIAISAKKRCTVTIINPNNPTWKGWKRTVEAGSWTKLTSPDSIPHDVWYDVNWTAATASENVGKHGLYITSTEEISVYSAVRMTNSYDATNVLPITALSQEYIVQDYPACNVESKSRKESRCVFTVLATENNTEVKITPANKTLKGKPAKQEFNIKLDKGQTYMVLGEDWANVNEQSSLSGSRVYSTDEKKPIAVFNGNVFTQIPGGKSARDCLYEQAMPTDYWGTEFIITRSMKKDANRIRITAKEDGTTIKIDGAKVATLDRGETYEFEMSNNVANELSRYITTEEYKVEREIPNIVNKIACYIETSCPCAVYNYDVSSGYRKDKDAESEYDKNNPGDPSMVWISPIQQRITNITFGSAGTNKTKIHFVNVVCLTDDTKSFQITKKETDTQLTNYTFEKVPGNPLYSYARIELDQTDKGFAYNMSSAMGLIAHVYGSGDNESYAYSVGSSTMKDGILINNISFTDSMRYSGHFCVGEEITFNAQVGSKKIDRVDWDFDDGTRATDGDVEIKHIYTTPGWYDMHVQMYSQALCTDEATVREQSLTFSFYVQEPVVANRRTKICAGEKWVYDGKTYDTPGTYTIDPILVGDCDSIINFVLQVNPVPAPVNIVDTMRNEGKVKDPVTGEYYSTDKAGTYVWTDIILSKGQCDSIINHKRTIQTCLVLNVENPAFDCNSTILSIPFDVLRGEASQIQDVYYMEGKSKQTVTRDDVNRYFNLDIRSLHAGKYAGAIVAKDKICGDSLLYTVEFDVSYPKDIFTFKQTNVLAVKNSANNGGYEFIGYQWYRNGEKIEGATGSIYHTTEDFIVGDQYFVVLTDNTGRTLQSCPQTIWDKTGITAAAPQRAAEKLLKGQQMLIRKDNKIYDIYGNEIK